MEPRDKTPSPALPSARRTEPGPDQDPLTALQQNLNQVIVGKTEVVRLLLTALLARGHVLLQDVPGTGKTVLVKALARSLDCDFSRIQCTPDLLPSDITGVSVFDQSNHRFEFQRGPIFANLVLADEVNRASPRTQAALLEGMAEGQVTSEGVTHQLPQPHFVVATQNPVDMQGTYPLPESQLDRFWLTLEMGQVDRRQINRILSEREHDEPLDAIGAVAGRDQIIAMQIRCMQVTVSANLREYIAELAEGIRQHPQVLLPASVRALLHLQRLGQAWAFLNGRAFVLPDDMKMLVKPALAHRLTVRPRSNPVEILDEILARTRVPLS